MEANDFLIELIKLKQEQKPQFSLRSIAMKSQVSPAILSRIINKKNKLSMNVVNKLVVNLELENHEKDRIVLLAMKDSLQSTWMKAEIDKKIDAIENTPCSNELENIEKLKESFSMKKIKPYFCRENDALRTLNIYSHSPKKDIGFSETVVRVRDSVSSEVFFIQQSNGKYSAYSNAHNTDPIYRYQLQSPANRHVCVEWLRKYPQISSVCIHLLGKSQYVVGEVLYSEKKVRISGECFSSIGEEVNPIYNFEYDRIS